MGEKQTPKFNTESYLIKKVWTFLASLSSITLKYQLSKLVRKRKKKSDKILKQPESLTVLSGASEGPGLRMHSLFFHSDVLIYGVTNNSSGLEFNVQSTSFLCLSMAVQRVLLPPRFVSSKMPELLALSIGQLCSENLTWSSSDPTSARGTLFGGEVEGLVGLFLMCTFGAHMYIMRGSLRLCLRKSHAVDGGEHSPYPLWCWAAGVNRDGTAHSSLYEKTISIVSKTWLRAVWILLRLRWCLPAIVGDC